MLKRKDRRQLKMVMGINIKSNMTSTRKDRTVVDMTSSTISGTTKAMVAQI